MLTLRQSSSEGTRTAIETEFIIDKFESLNQLEIELFNTVYWFNNLKPYSSLQFLTQWYLRIHT